jgi:hypothetical protein
MFSEKHAEQLLALSHRAHKPPMAMKIIHRCMRIDDMKKAKSMMSCIGPFSFGKAIPSQLLS